MNKKEIYKNLLKNMYTTYESKNSDYGDSFGKSVEKYGLISALTRISDKFNRLENLILTKENKVGDETLLDTLLDMANYCIMTAIECEPKDKNISLEECMYKVEKIENEIGLKK